MPSHYPPPTPTPTPKALQAQDQAGPPLYLEGPSIVNTYQIEQGVCILPLAEDPPTDPTKLAAWSPVVVLRLHSPYRIRTAKFAAKKNLTPPVIPSPSDTGAFVFVGGNLAFTNVINPAGGHDWTNQTAYVYVENCVSRTEDGFVLGTPGFTYPSQYDNARLVGGTPQVDSPGAIAYAGEDAKIGYYLSRNETLAMSIGLYNTISYFPGTLFNDGLMNGSLTSGLLNGGFA